MDCALDLLLPAALQRLQFALSVFAETLLPSLSSSDAADFNRVVSGNDSAASASALLAVLQTPAQHMPSPETDCPGAGHPDLLESRLRVHSAVLRSWQQAADSFPVDRFELVQCMRALLELSDGWSYRDLGKALSGVRFDVMATEKCQLTSRMWIKEMLFRAQQTQTMTSQGRD